MQVATQAAAFFLARRHKALPCALEVGGQAHCMNCHLCLPGKVLQQAMVCRGKRLACAARRKVQLPHELALVDQRQAEHIITAYGTTYGRSNRELVVLLQRYGNVRQLEGLGDGLHDRLEHGIRRERCFQALAKSREHGVRVVAFTVHQPIHAALEAHAQRMEEHGDDADCQDRDEPVTTCAEDNQVRRAHDEHIQGGDSAREGAEDERAVDHAVHVPQPVAHEDDEKRDGNDHE